MMKKNSPLFIYDDDGNITLCFAQRARVTDPRLRHGLAVALCEAREAINRYLRNGEGNMASVRRTMVYGIRLGFETMQRVQDEESATKRRKGRQRLTAALLVTQSHKLS